MTESSIGTEALLAAMLAGGRGNCGSYGGSGDAGLHVVTKSDMALQGIGDIKAAIPLAEGQVQLALAGLKDSLTSQATANVLHLTNALAATNTSLAAGFGAIGTAISNSTRDAVMATTLQGEATRNLINANQVAELTRLLGTASAEVIELRGDSRNERRSRETEVNVTQNVTQAQAQAQSQAQMQNVYGAIRDLCSRFDTFQHLSSVSKTVNIGSGQARGGDSTNTNNNV